MSTETSNGQSADVPSNQTEKGKDPTQISALNRYREQGSSSASSAQNDGQPKDGESSANTGSDGREQFIPRSRFDQVNEQRNQFQQEAAQAQQQLIALQQQMLQQQMQPNPTGMVGAPPAPQAPAFNPNDPEFQERWRKRLADNPIQGMAEFMQEFLQHTGTPMIEQLRSEIMGQVQPLRDGYVSQQVQQYAQQRAAQDPSFQQVAPHLQQVVSQALSQRPDLQLNGQTLQVLEQIARVNASQQQFGLQPGYGMQTPVAPIAPTAPFTERPGQPQANTGPQDAPITPEIRAMAARFRMDPQQYANAQREMNNAR